VLHSPEQNRTPLRTILGSEDVPQLQVILDDQQLTTALVRRCIAGDSAAWEEIVRNHNRRVYNICYRFTNSADDAEDLAQEVFIKVYRTLKSYDLEKGAFTTWLTTVTRNLLVDHFRRSKQDRMTDSMDASPLSEEDSPTLGDTIQDTSATPDETYAAKQRQKLVQDALQKLSPDLREAVILRDLQDMDYKEIAAALKVPEGTVKSRINRGRTELARILSRTYKQVI
jgi:RNA polymerase sigma-70 factor (ECF subfamily)